MADADPVLVEKLQRILATRKEPAIQAKARAALTQLGADITPPPDAAKADRIARETAAGQMEAPGVLDKLKTALNPAAIGESLKSAGGAALRGAEGAGSAFMDKFAFGLPGRAWDALGGATGMWDSSPQARAQQEQASPVGNVVGSTLGLGASALAGPEAAVGRSAQGLLGMLEQRVPAMANTAVGRIAGQTGAGALMGSGVNAAQVATQGGDMQDVGDAALAGAKGGAMVGGGLGALGEGTNRVADAVMSSEGGQARRLIERYGGKVGPLTSGKGGAFDQELAGLPANGAGVGEAARQRAANILNETERAHYDNTVMPAAREKAAIAASSEGHAPVDVTKVYSDLVHLSRNKRLTPSEQGQVKAVLSSMEDSNGVPRDMTQAELNDFKGMLQDLSDTGSANPSVAAAKLQGVAHSTKELVDQGPYADVNARTSEGIGKYDRQRQLLDMAPRPTGNRMSPEGPPEAEVAKLGNALARQGQDTVTAGVRGADRYQQFVDENPQFRRDLELPDVLKAKADLGVRFSPSSHHGLLGKLSGASAGAGAGATAAMAAAHMGPVAALPIGAAFAAQNWPAITGRLLYTPAMEAAAATGIPRQLPGFLPQIEQDYMDALARYQAQQKERR